MISFVTDGEMTRDGDLASWQEFCLAYYDPILRALRLLNVPAGEVDDLAHSFLLKVAEKNFLDSYRGFQEREHREGRRARFRTYLYRSIQNHVRDFYRRRNLGERPFHLSSEVAQSLEAEPESTLDPDALYALDILHQALQALRRHCERTGKPHFWVFFEEMLLANEFRGRKAKTRDELLAAYPGLTPQRLDNGLTTAKRAFRRFVEEVIPRGLRDEVRPGEQFEEWMAILRHSNASQFNLLHLAYRVMPFPGPDMSQTVSEALVVDSCTGGRTAWGYEEPVSMADDDEFGILLGFRLELPLSEMIDPTELTKYIAPSNPLWALARTCPRANTTNLHPSRDPTRPVCLLTLIDPTPAEVDALSHADLLGLLARIKLLAKQLRHYTNHFLPNAFAQLLYTLVNVLALVKCGVDLHSITPESLAGNIRWFLNQPWLDDRIRPLLLTGLNLLQRDNRRDSGRA